MTCGPWTIYARQLFPLSYGHPLWRPEPCPTFGEVHLGDVGYLEDSHFCFLFNVTEEPTADSNYHPVNVRGVPDGFQPLDLPGRMIKRRPNEITQPLLHSKSLQATSLAASASLSECGAAASASLSYQCQAEEGALLMLKKPAHRTYLDCDLRIRRYIRENISSWCAFANDQLEIGLEEKDIIFVSGYTKTPVWAEAAFSHSSASGELVIAGGVPSASGEFRVSMSRAVDASVFSRTGPLDRASMWSEKDPEPSEICDQSIFLNYYKMKSRALWRSTVIRAAAGDHVFPYGDDDDKTSGAGSCPSSDGEYPIQDEVEEAYDPVDSLLNHILKHSEADVAWASDADLSSLFKDEILPKDLENALETLSPSIIVDEDGVGMIIPSQNASLGRTVHASHPTTGATTTLGAQRSDTPTFSSIAQPPPIPDFDVSDLDCDFDSLSSSLFCNWIFSLEDVGMVSDHCAEVPGAVAPLPTWSPVSMTLKTEQDSAFVPIQMADGIYSAGRTLRPYMIGPPLHTSLVDHRSPSDYGQSSPPSFNHTLIESPKAKTSESTCLAFGGPDNPLTEQGPGRAPMMTRFPVERLDNRRPRAPVKGAVLVGTNYMPAKTESVYPPLRRAQDDVKDSISIAPLAGNYGYLREDLVMMLDGESDGADRQPTRANILRKTQTLAKDAQLENPIVFFCSGRSGQDEPKPEEGDGLDEIVFPFDHPVRTNLRQDKMRHVSCRREMESRMVLDNTLPEASVESLHTGAHLTAIFDSCHSGTLLDVDDCLGHDTIYNRWKIQRRGVHRKDKQRMSQPAVKVTTGKHPHPGSNSGPSSPLTKEDSPCTRIYQRRRMGGTEIWVRVDNIDGGRRRQFSVQSRHAFEFERPPNLTRVMEGGTVGQRTDLLVGSSSILVGERRHSPAWLKACDGFWEQENNPFRNTTVLSISFYPDAYRLLESDISSFTQWFTTILPRDPHLAVGSLSFIQELTDKMYEHAQKTHKWSNMRKDPESEDSNALADESEAHPLSQTHVPEELRPLLDLCKLREYSPPQEWKDIPVVCRGRALSATPLGHVHL